MKIKTTVSAAIIGILFILSNPLQAQEKHSTKWNEESRISEVTCDGLATFTLDINQKPSSSDLPSLCGCLARETNQRGWEVDVLKKMQSGIEPSFIEKHGAIARFGQAVDKCASGNYQLTSAPELGDTQEGSGKLTLGSKQLLGFLSAGPLGIFVAPWAYDVFGGNLVAWIIAGVIAGGFLWNITLGLLFNIFGYILSIGSKRSDG